MSDKPVINIATGFSGGVSVGVAVDTYAELTAVFIDLFGEAGPDVVDGLLANLQAQSLAGTAALEQATKQSVEGTLGVPAPGNFGAPPVFQPASAGGPPPGQTHDPADPAKTKWVPAGVSKKTNKPYAGFWSAPR
jgi:hypothetical protein